MKSIVIISSLVLLSNYGVDAIQMKRTETGTSPLFTCPIGKYVNQGLPYDTCLCPPSGRYSAVPVTLNMLPKYCKSGTYSVDEGISGCNLGISACLNCTAGKYSLFPGEYSPLSACTDCVAGKYSIEASSSCSNSCPGGYYASSNSAECLKCSAGSYSSDGASVCVSCSAGSYSDVDGATACSPCSVGYFTAGTGRTACRLSAAGYKTTGYDAVTYVGATNTIGCGANKYSLAGATICTECDLGKYSAAGSSVCV